MKKTIYRHIRKKIPICLSDIKIKHYILSNRYIVFDCYILNSVFFDELKYEYFEYSEKVSLFKSNILLFEIIDGIIIINNLFMQNNNDLFE